MRNVLASVWFAQYLVNAFYSNSKETVAFPEPKAEAKPVTSSIAPNLV
jgi:hypothetical protein